MLLQYALYCPSKCEGTGIVPAHNMKAYGGVSEWFDSFLTSILDEVSSELLSIGTSPPPPPPPRKELTLPIEKVARWTTE